MLVQLFKDSYTCQIVIPQVVAVSALCVIANHIFNSISEAVLLLYPDHTLLNSNEISEEYKEYTKLIATNDKLLKEVSELFKKLNINNN